MCLCHAVQDVQGSSVDFVALFDKISESQYIFMQSQMFPNTLTVTINSQPKVFFLKCVT